MSHHPINHGALPHFALEVVGTALTRGLGSDMATATAFVVFKRRGFESVVEGPMPEPAAQALMDKLNHALHGEQVIVETRRHT